MAQLNIQATKKHKDREQARASNSLQALRGMSPKAAGIWVDNNVNTLADAKKLLKTLTKAVIALSHQIDK